MELFVTKNSPYARLTRALLHELGINDRVPVTLAETRTENSPYYAVNPSGRVPYLVCDDGIGFEESDLIGEYLCALCNSDLWAFPDGDEGLELRRLHGLCRSYLDGLSVWLREAARPVDAQFATLIAHERARARRLTTLWEHEIESPLMQGPLNRTQMTLFCALEIEQLLPGFDWRTGHPNLLAWYERQSLRPSFSKTARGTL
tara:strand:- start:1579 stop:2187 length:609 start_codon:yes stop_codon:yes gene_type:complete